MSVALPRWCDVIAYEEKDPACRDALQTIYPRFGLHPLIQELVQPSEFAGTTVWPYPTEAAAQAALADQLAGHAKVNWVRYPHRSDHPQHQVATRQMRAGGAIVTVSFNASQEQTYALCKQLRWFTMAESLGGIESLICHPATMTHAAVSAEVKAKLGIDDGLVRFSVGCEDLADLQADLDQALELLA